MIIFNSRYWIFNTRLGISQSRYTRYHDKHARNHTSVLCGVPATTTGGKTHPCLPKGGQQLPKFLLRISAYKSRQWGSRLISHHSSTRSVRYCVSECVYHTNHYGSQYHPIKSTSLGYHHRNPDTRAFQISPNIQRVLQRRESMQENHIYTYSWSVLLFLQNKTHRIWNCILSDHIN